MNFRRHQRFAVWGEQELGDREFKGRQGLQRLAARGIPQPDYSFFPGRCQDFAVGREGDEVDVVGVARQRG